MPANNRHLVSIIITMVSAIGFVTILASVALKPINQKNGFVRKFVNNELKLLHSFERPENVLDFAGNASNFSYFKTKEPNRLFVVDNINFKTSFLEYSLPNSKLSSGFQIIVDSPFVNYMAGSIPIIIKSKLGDKQISEGNKLPALFTRSVPITTSSYVIRIFEGLDQIFAKFNLMNGEMVKEKNKIKRNKDAGISTDGMLEFDSQNNQLIYVHLYNNSILYLDTNLNLIKYSSTIDTLANVQFKAGASSEHSITNLTPKRIVNACCSVSKGNLYVNSMLSADNEDIMNLKDKRVVDIYDTKNHIYKGSFYLPSYNGEKPQSFKVLSDKIIVLYKHAITNYSLPNVL